MRFTRLITLAVLVSVLISLVAITIGGLYHLSLPIPSHQGDGAFRDRSRWVGPFRARGYEIKMADFDLGIPYEAEYRVTHLADFAECDIYVAFADPKWILWDTRVLKTMEGELCLKTLDSDNKVVTLAKGKLGEHKWGSIGDIHVAYQNSNSFFVPKFDENYRIRLRYRPDPKLIGYRGFVYIRSRADI